MSQQTIEKTEDAPHVFASYTVTPVPLFPGPNDAEHARVIDMLADAIENGTPAELGTLATLTGTLQATGTLTADNDNHNDSDSTSDA